jgi:hypothetical protein
MIGAFACVVAAIIIAGIYGPGRDKNWKWQVTTEANRVPSFFVVVLIFAAIALVFFGPKGA